MKTRAESRPVDFADSLDLECAVLGEAGWYSKAIARETGLTPHQVNYRLGRAGIKRADYRNGQSDIARHTLNQIKMRDREKQLVKSAQGFSDKIDALQKKYIETLEESRSEKAHAKEK